MTSIFDVFTSFARDTYILGSPLVLMLGLLFMPTRIPRYRSERRSDPRMVACADFFLGRLTYPYQSYIFKANTSNHILTFMLS